MRARWVGLGVWVIELGCGGASGGLNASAGADASADASAGVDADARSGCSGTLQPDAAMAPVSVQGDTGSTEGIFDPSLAYPPAATTGYMTYSSVPAAAGVHTRIATSSDHGASWSYVGDVNDSSAATVPTTDLTVCLAATCSGTWVHEVSSIVLDPGDPDAAR